MGVGRNAGEIGCPVASEDRQAKIDYSRRLYGCQARERILCGSAGLPGGEARSRRESRLSTVSANARCALLQAGLAREAADSVAPYVEGDGERTTRATPSTVRPMPSNVVGPSCSLNSSQAIKAVQGGTRYIRLVTWLAAPRWISRNSS